MLKTHETVYEIPAISQHLGNDEGDACMDVRDPPVPSSTTLVQAPPVPRYMQTTLSKAISNNPELTSNIFVPANLKETVDTKLTNPMSKTILVGECEVSSKAKKLSKLVDESTFSFKPQVNPTSLKMMENVNSDFMSRQQQHLEKQKKYVSISIEQYNSR